ncbi:MAG: DUF4340 domain-containing protein [Chthoniobacterales bacterium]
MVEETAVNRYVTLALLLLAATLAMFLLFIEPQLKNAHKRQIAGGYVLEMDPSQVNFIKIGGGGTQPIELRKRDSGWKIVKPEKDNASSEAVEKILRAAQDLKILDVMTVGNARESGLKAHDFGLSNSKQTIELGGDQKVELLFGKDATGDKRVYMRRGDSEDIYIVGDALQEVAFRNLDDFRDKHLTNLHSDQVSAFVIKRPEGEMRLERKANQWEIMKPLHANADSAKVNQFLDRILGMQIVKLVSSGVSGQNADSLPDVSAQLIIQPENSDGKEITLRLGPSASDGKGGVLAELSSRSSTYELPDAVVKMLSVTPEAFRDKVLLRMNPDVLDRIVMQTAKGITELRRRNGGWVTIVDGKDQLLPEGAVEGLLKFLGKVEAERFITADPEDIAKFGIDQPTLTLQFQAWLSENTPEEQAGPHDISKIVFGKQVGDKIYAQKDNSPEVLVVSAGVETFIEGGPEIWRTEFAGPAASVSELPSTQP